MSNKELVPQNVMIADTQKHVEMQCARRHIFYEDPMRDVSWNRKCIDRWLYAWWLELGGVGVGKCLISLPP